MAPACSTAVPTCSSSLDDGGEPRQITDGDWDDGGGLVADGTSIAFASNRAADRDWEDRTSTCRPWAVAKKLTKSRHALVAGLVADGTTIACLGRTVDAPPRTFESGPSHPAAATRPASRPTWTSRSAATS